MKTRGGWRETPQAHQVDLAVRDLSSVSDEELMQIIDQFRTASGTVPAVSSALNQIIGDFSRLP